jgi:hypothetical protein
MMSDMKRISLAALLAALFLAAACSVPPFTLPQPPSAPAWPQVPVTELPLFSWFYGPFSALMWVLMLFVYMLPTIVAAARRSRHLLLVLLLNVLLGWSFVGWIVALVLALI